MTGKKIQFYLPKNRACFLKLAFEIEPPYQLEKEHKLSFDNEKMSEGKAFLDTQLCARRPDAW